MKLVLRRLLSLGSLFLALSHAGSLVHAEILFEGYYVIKSQGTPVGYQIARYESLNEGKNFKATTFTKTDKRGGDITESVVTESDGNLFPLSLSYIGLINKQASQINAKVINQVLKGTKSGVTTSKETSFELILPKGVFFSGVLIYAILKSPEGLKKNTSYRYQTLVEETGEIIAGQAKVEGDDILFRKRFKTYLISNDFKGHKFNSWVTERGEILKTEAPALGIVQELVPEKEMATTGFVVPKSTLEKLFGGVPIGANNIAYSAYQKGEWPSMDEVVKEISKDNVPPGMGVHTKKRTK